MTINKANFRYDINALRAIAVIGVAFFHFNVPFFNGGFSGVDIFYVISGYLMTRIIMNGLQMGNFSVLEFYGKRVQRILPALIFLILSLIIICFFIYLPNEYKIIAKNSAASLLFFSNVLYGLNGNYFDASSDTNILLHTWSLSVEWQFYLILPFLLLLLNLFFKNDTKKYLIFFVILTSVIFVCSIIATKFWSTASFYLLPTRSWEMLVGGIAFLCEGRIKINFKHRWALIGYFILLVCIVGLNDRMSWPGLLTLLPVLSTFTIIISDFNDLKILKARIVQFLGKISYSLYLWHWPVFVIANYIGVQENFLSILSLISISTILAFLSYRYIESIKFERSRAILLATIVLIIITTSFSFKNVNNIAFMKETLEIANYRQTHLQEIKAQYSMSSCFLSAEGKGFSEYNKDQCLGIQKGKKNIILLGDSHAAHLSQSLRDDLALININMSQASSSGCMPILKKNGQARCSELIDYIYFHYLPENASNIDGIMISANWAASNDIKGLANDLHETMKYLNKLKIRTIILGQSETYTISFASIAAREYQSKSQFSDNYLTNKSREANSVMMKEFGKYYINIYNTGKFAKLSSANIPYMSDQNHLSKYGADQVAKTIMEDKIFTEFIQ